jgi:hypothetical protein
VPGEHRSLTIIVESHSLSQKGISKKAMKKLIAGAALMLGIAVGYPQGQVNFANKVAASGIDARVFVVPAASWAVSPPQAACLTIDSGGTLTYIPGSATTFRTTPAAATGYILPLVVTVPGHDITTTVTLRMFAYTGPATDIGASHALSNGAFPDGISNPVTVTLGGGAALPPNMVGLQGFVLGFPEPSTIALVLLGAAVIFIRRRK